MSAIVVFTDQNEAMAYHQATCNEGVNSILIETETRPTFVPTQGDRRHEPADSDTYYLVISPYTELLGRC